MAFLYTNENFPVKVTVALRALGHDVLTSQEAGQANQAVADADVLRFATAQAALYSRSTDVTLSGCTASALLMPAL